MEEKKGKTNPEGIETRLLRLLQRMQHLELGKIPNQGLDVTMAQMHLIRFVGENPGCHIQDVADGLGLSPPTVSVSIKRLEELGLMERNPDPEDGRAACLTLTRKSKNAFQQVKVQMFEHVQEFLSYLTDEEQNNLIDYMDKAVNGLEITARQKENSTN